VGRYADTMARLARDSRDNVVPLHPREPRPEESPAESIPESAPLIPLPTLPELPDSMARMDALRAISERLAPMAVVDRTLRLAIAGCRPGDGVSSVAAALALDLSQRLSLKTALVDAHIRHPSLHRLFCVHRERPTELVLEGTLQIRSAGWPRLDLATCYVGDDDRQRAEVINDFEGLFPDYQAVVIDMGIPRLDARMLPLVRSSDPILLVIRYAATEKKELSTTTTALRAANRSLAGVIVNGKRDPVFKPIRSLMLS
jgi:Mrp family chromosome partitioning ATPase